MGEKINKKMNGQNQVPENIMCPFLLQSLQIYALSNKWIFLPFRLGKEEWCVGRVSSLAGSYVLNCKSGLRWVIVGTHSSIYSFLSNDHFLIAKRLAAWDYQTPKMPFHMSECFIKDERGARDEFGQISIFVYLAARTSESPHCRLEIMCHASFVSILSLKVEKDSVPKPLFSISLQISTHFLR